MFKFEDQSNKGQPGGYAGLGSDGTVPTAQLPDPAVLSAKITMSANHLFNSATDGPWTLVPGIPGRVLIPHRIQFHYRCGSRLYGCNNEGAAFGVWSGTNLELPTWLLASGGATSDDVTATLSTATMAFIDACNYNVAFFDTIEDVAFMGSVSPGGADWGLRLSDLTGQPLVVAFNGDLNLGQTATFNIDSPGSGYAVDDTLGGSIRGTTDVWGTVQNAPTIRVTSVDGGAVTGFEIIDEGNFVAPTVNPIGSQVTLDSGDTGVSPQPGVGTGLILSIASQYPGNGTLDIITQYSVIDVS